MLYWTYWLIKWYIRDIHIKIIDYEYLNTDNGTNVCKKTQQIDEQSIEPPKLLTILHNYFKTHFPERRLLYFHPEIFLMPYVHHSD